MEELRRLVDELANVTKELKMREAYAKELKGALETMMKANEEKRLETKKGVAFFSSGKSVSVDKKKLYIIKKKLKEANIEPDFEYRKTIRYVRVNLADEVGPSFDVLSNASAIIDELIRLNAELSSLKSLKKELSSKVAGIMSKIGVQEFVTSKAIVKYIEYDKTMIDYEKLKEYLSMVGMEEEEVFKTRTYEKFVVVDWAAYQKMLEHARAGGDE